MTKKITRRSFIKQTGGIGATALIGSTLVPKLLRAVPSPQNPDIAVIKGTDYFNNTFDVIKMLGGIQNFVPKNSVVGLLINSDFEYPGVYVEPDVSLAVVKMCFDASAKEVVCLQHVLDEYWQWSKHADEYNGLISNVKTIKSNRFPAEFNDTDWIRDQYPDHKSLKDTEIIKALFECDVFINISISKHHGGTLYTGALKNMMGVCTRECNVTYHLGGAVRNDPDHLGQCIADINLVRKPDLCIVDSTNFLITNGPVGPGDIQTEHKIVASTDIVAIDSLCSSFLGFGLGEINHIQKAHESGLGQIDYNKLNIKEITI